MKPDAPEDYRGEFRPIKTNVSGIEVCELLPLHAKIADKYNIVRSICHDFADHGGGHKRFMTGRIPQSPVDFVNDSPAVGSIVAKVREQRQVGIPNYISGADAGRDQRKDHGGDEDFEHGELFPRKGDVTAVAVDFPPERIQP